MKNYTTWEAVKMITENPEFKFINQENQILSLDGNKMLQIENRLRPLFSTEDVWSKIQIPVDFITAVKAFSNGKVIKLVKNTVVRKFYRAINTQLKDSLGNSLTADDILNGKWYIEE